MTSITTARSALTALMIQSGGQSIPTTCEDRRICNYKWQNELRHGFLHFQASLHGVPYYSLCASGEIRMIADCNPVLPVIPEELKIALQHNGHRNCHVSE